MYIFCICSLAHFIVIDLITFIIFDERYKLWSSSLNKFVYCPSACLLLGLIIALNSTFYSDTLSPF
jgi:hypothetical protein